jgi:hypothetical protein
MVQSLSDYRTRSRELENELYWAVVSLFSYYVYYEESDVKQVFLNSPSNFVSFEMNAMLCS